MRRHESPRKRGEWRIPFLLPKTLINRGAVPLDRGRRPRRPVAVVESLASPNERASPGGPAQTSITPGCVRHIGLSLPCRYVRAGCATGAGAGSISIFLRWSYQVNFRMIDVTTTTAIAYAAIS